MRDKVKLAIAVVLVGAGIWGYYWLAESALVIRILAVVAWIAAGAAVGWGAAGIRAFGALRSRRAWDKPFPTTTPTVNIRRDTKMNRLKMTAISR